MGAAAILNLLFLSILVKCLFAMAANYTAAEFHSFTSIGGRVIVVCA